LRQTSFDTFHSPPRQADTKCFNKNSVPHGIPASRRTFLAVRGDTATLVPVGSNPIGTHFPSPAFPPFHLLHVASTAAALPIRTLLAGSLRLWVAMSSSTNRYVPFELDVFNLWFVEASVFSSGVCHMFHVSSCRALMGQKPPPSNVKQTIVVLPVLSPGALLRHGIDTKAARLARTLSRKLGGDRARRECPSRPVLQSRLRPACVTRRDLFLFRAAYSSVVKRLKRDPPHKPVTPSPACAGDRVIAAFLVRVLLDWPSRHMPTESPRCPTQPTAFGVECMQDKQASHCRVAIATVKAGMFINWPLTHGVNLASYIKRALPGPKVLSWRRLHRHVPTCFPFLASVRCNILPC